MQNASLDKAGNAGEYVAMVWPPMAPREIVVSEIVGPRESGVVRWRRRNGSMGVCRTKRSLSNITIDWL